MAKKASNTGKKQGKKRGNPGIGKAGKDTRFKPNDPETGEKDPRINRNGRPKSFDQLRALFQDIASEEIVDQGKKRTRAQAIGIAMSMDKKLMREFLEFAYGKVPQAVTVEGGDRPLTFRIVHDDIARNEDPSAKAVPPEADGSDQQ